jgi:fumarylacetoacetase
MREPLEPLQSWVEGANGPHGFGLNHLPYGAMRHQDTAHLCVRIGEMVLDLHAAAKDGLLDSLATEVQRACQQPVLNTLLALGSSAWIPLRELLTALLAEDSSGATKTRLDWFLHFVEHCEIVLPIAPRGYTDFYASIDHARRVGELFRPDAPLLPNYKHVPIAYNGRPSSVVAGGTAVRRPWGQTRPVGGAEQPGFEPAAALDYEAELAFVMGAGNELGSPIAIGEAREHVFGVALLNDWSARDIQAWEYQPLGPFLGKSFATSLSPWITPMAALEPFRVAARARAESDPLPLPYLADEGDEEEGALDIAIEVRISTMASRAAGLAPMLISHGNTRGLYWTAAQMVAHHTSNGCNLEPGDVLATGTVSGVERESAGCLLELTRNGTEPVTLPNGEERAWLQDGDEVTLAGWCERDGVAPVALEECVGRVWSSR